jgi:hypothetical protein
VVAVGILFLVPLILGANPIDVLKGEGKETVQEIRTVEERVVKAGQEAVVEAAAKALPATVNIEVQAGSLGTGIGSGFIFDSDGYIATTIATTSDMRKILAPPPGFGGGEGKGGSGGIRGGTDGFSRFSVMIISSVVAGGSPVRSGPGIYYYSYVPLPLEDALPEPPVPPLPPND